MAQIVGYYENNVEYKEGPFVATHMDDSGDYRLEVENKRSGKGCPCLPDSSIYDFIRASKLPFMDTRGRWAEVEACVDHLNRMVREGKIVLDVRGFWRMKGKEDPIDAFEAIGCPS